MALRSGAGAEVVAAEDIVIHSASRGFRRRGRRHIRMEEEEEEAGTEAREAAGASATSGHRPRKKNKAKEERRRWRSFVQGALARSVTGRPAA